MATLHNKVGMVLISNIWARQWLTNLKKMENNKKIHKVNTGIELYNIKAKFELKIKQLII